MNPDGDQLIDRPGRDYLLISSFPNIHSKNFCEDDRLIIASGMHGGGTRAFGQLISQPSMLEKIPQWSPDNLGWQILIEVVLDDNLMPTGKMEVHKPHFIEADYQELHKLLGGAAFYIDKSDPFLEKSVGAS